MEHKGQTPQQREKTIVLTRRQVLVGTGMGTLTALLAACGGTASE